jgi:hypothetical protein
MPCPPPRRPPPIATFPGVQWEGLLHYNIARSVEALTRYTAAFDETKDWSVAYRISILKLLDDFTAVVKFRHESQVMHNPPFPTPPPPPPTPAPTHPPPAPHVPLHTVTPCHVLFPLEAAGRK